MKKTMLKVLICSAVASLVLSVSVPVYGMRINTGGNYTIIAPLSVAKFYLTDKSEMICISQKPKMLLTIENAIGEKDTYTTKVVLKNLITGVSVTITNDSRGMTLTKYETGRIVIKNIVGEIILDEMIMPTLVEQPLAPITLAPLSEAEFYLTDKSEMISMSQKPNLSEQSEMIIYKKPKMLLTIEKAIGKKDTYTTKVVLKNLITRVSVTITNDSRGMTLTKYETGRIVIKNIVGEIILDEMIMPIVVEQTLAPVTPIETIGTTGTTGTTTIPTLIELPAGTVVEQPLAPITLAPTKSSNLINK